MRRSTRATLVASLAALALLAPTAPVTPRHHRPPAAAPQAATAPPKSPIAVGCGGAVSSVDPDATRVGLQVLRSGGNAVDAAVATAAALGVTEPYSAGIGGGGYFVYYDAKSGKVRTIDGRETAPAAMPRDAFIDPETTGEPYTFTPELVTSGVSVGVPGTPPPGSARSTGGARAASRVADARRPARPRGLRRRPDLPPARPPTTRCGSTRSDPTRRLFLPRRRRARASARRSATPTSRAPTGCSPTSGLAPFYPASSPARSSRTVRRPPKTADTDLPVPPGYMTRGDLARYRVIDRRRPRSRATAATTSTAWRRPPPAAPRSARRSTSSSATTSPR